ncbi:MAG: HD domain-containing protein [Firmicutes bacterium]|nr:HD domain-containing protein [Bacillota bacterium]
MTLEEIKEKLKKNIKPERYIHSINVMNTASDLAGYYSVDKRKAEVAGILHDCARDFQKENMYELCREFGIEIDEIKKRQPELLHGPVGAYIAEADYGIKDEAILEAIRVHTTGKENMSMLEKIIFISDYIEPGRKFPGVNNIREWALKDIDRAMVFAFDSTIRYVLEKGTLLHPDTVSARNYIIMHSVRWHRSPD